MLTKWSKEEDELITTLANDGLTWKEISKNFNRSEHAVRARAKKIKIGSSFKHNHTKTLAKVLEKGFILIGQVEAVNKNTTLLCPFCQEKFEATLSNLARKSVKSCGCVKIGKRCGTKNITGQYIATLKYRSKYYNVDYSLDNQFIDDLLVKQKFKCAISGLPIDFGYGNNPKTASLDRIDSNRGYFNDNVQWVHKDINLMKNFFDQNYFIQICKKVAENNK
jgi:hypothetical protein